MNTSSYLRRVGTAVATASLLGFSLAPQLAQAHGIADSARNKSVGEFVPLGIEHMLTGFDHLLFIAGVVLLAGTARRAAKLISLFVLGHSLTLLAATLSGWQISATLVDVVIALSVAYVGVLNLRGGEPDWRMVGGAVFGFGLVHGLGLSTRLQHLGLPDEGLLGRVIAFNVGVEIGQLVAIALVVSIGTLVLRRVPLQQLRRAGAVAFVASGTLAAFSLSVEAI
jgi:hydrogenase/urease accessory protein HupE